MKKLEDEIKQKKFDSQSEKFFVNLIYTYNFFQTHFENILKPFDITSQQYNILRILRGQYPHAIQLNEIKNRMLDKNSDVSRLVERLRKKNLLNRNINPNNRRAVEISITTQGLDILKNIEPHLHAFHKKINHLTDHELENINHALDKIRFYFEQNNT